MIVIKDIVNDSYTNTSGYTLLVALKPFFDKNKSIKVSFEDLTPMSTSFMNSSIGELIDIYGIDKFKSIFKPVLIKKSQASMLLKYIATCERTAK